MRIEKDRRGLVRGVIHIYQDHGRFEEITAYTLWYRHDTPDLEKVVNDAVDRIIKAYSVDRFRFNGAVYGTEWKSYIDGI